MKPICIFHKGCTDGFGAAWVLHSMFGEGRVDFVAANYGDAPPDVLGRAVYIVDFSYKRDVILEMAKKATSIVILDHHKTAKEELDFNPNTLAEKCYCPMTIAFDMNHSGAMLAWKYFYTADAPALIKHIEDRDLWKFELEGTREIIAALYSYPMEFDVWDKLMEEDIEKLRVEGAAIDRAHLKNVTSMIKYGTYPVKIAGYGVPAVNAPHMYASDVGNQLSETAPFAVIWIATENSVRFSLRSSANNPEHVDVSEIAKLFGGGGHKHAAGFEISREEIGQSKYDDLLGEL